MSVRSPAKRPFAKPAPSKSDRLEARVNPEQKEILRQAADLLGRSISDFIVTSSTEAARRVIEEHHLIRLTAEDNRVFVDALLHPPAPARKLRAAAARYKKAMGR